MTCCSRGERPGEEALAAAVVEKTDRWVGNEDDDEEKNINDDNDDDDDNDDVNDDDDDDDTNRRRNTAPPSRGAEKSVDPPCTKRPAWPCTPSTHRGRKQSRR